jgi:hypothetical protein
MAEQVFRGRSEDAAAPFIPSEWWEKGKSIAFVVERVFKIEGRVNYGVRLLKAQVLDGETTEEVSIGESAGFRMAMQAAHCKELREGDRVVLTCYGETASKKKDASGKLLSPRKDFEIEISRPEVEEYIPEYAR